MEATALRKLDAARRESPGVRLKSGTNRHGWEKELSNKTMNLEVSDALDRFHRTYYSMGVGLGHAGRGWNDSPVACCCRCGRVDEDPAQRSAERNIK
jgi:hypothetical protein